MQKLVQGIHHFQNYVFRSKQNLFQELSRGQSPSALFITCSDSRINPNLITQTDPGEIFVLRNAGNIIPASPYSGGEIATIEFAVKELCIRDIIVCGHSDCGAMKGLLNPGNKDMPFVDSWLRHAKRTVEIINAEYRSLKGDSLLTATVEENVMVQIENLRTHSFIEESLQRGELNLHAWVYKFETGQVFAYDAERCDFEKL